MSEKEREGEKERKRKRWEQRQRINEEFPDFKSSINIPLKESSLDFSRCE